MPRSNRPRGRRVGDDDDAFDLERLKAGWQRTEVKRSGVWNVQPVSEAAAAKEYLCPGCRLTIEVGMAHLVAWRADGLMGDAADLAARRHWHRHCWRMEP